MAISNSLESGNDLEFETTDKHDTGYWRLTLTAKTKGFAARLGSGNADRRTREGAMPIRRTPTPLRYAES
jgi:hypothetical protein